MKRLARNAILSIALATVPVLAVAPSTSVAAPSEADTKKALELLKTGKAALEKKKYAEGIKDLEGSFAIIPSPNSLLFIARGYLGLGDLPKAYAKFDQTVRLADSKGDPKYKETKDSAAHERDAIAGKLLLIDVKVANTGAGKIKAGSVEVEPEGWGSPLPANPGSVEVQLILPNGNVVKQTVNGQAGQRVATTLDASPAPAAGGGPPPPPPPPPEEKKGGGLNILIPVGAGVAGLGVIGMVTFAITGSMSQSIYDDLLSQCPGGNPCTTVDQDKVAEGKTMQAVANATLGIGIVALAAGGALIAVGIVQGPPKKKTEGAVKVEPVLGIGFVGARGSF